MKTGMTFRSTSTLVSEPFSTTRVSRTDTAAWFHTTNSFQTLSHATTFFNEPRMQDPSWRPPLISQWVVQREGRSSLRNSSETTPRAISGTSRSLRGTFVSLRAITRRQAWFVCFVLLAPFSSLIIPISDRRAKKDIPISTKKPVPSLPYRLVHHPTHGDHSRIPPRSRVKRCRKPKISALP